MDQQWSGARSNRHNRTGESGGRGQNRPSYRGQINLSQPTGAPYRMTYIAVITTRNGEIQSYRDYWSPAAAADVIGGAQALLNAFPGSTHE